MKDMENPLNLKLTSMGAMIFAVIWALTNYSMHVSNPFLTRLAGVAGVGLAVLDALHGGLSN